MVLVNAAGCGSAMKDYGHVLRDEPDWAERAEAFAARVRDVTEFLAEVEPRAERGPLAGIERIAYHDACHLAHAQAVRAQPRELLRGIPGLEVIDPDGWEICCGSAGIYNLTQPEPAAELGRRKVANLRATGATAIAAANPGCAIQIAAHAEATGDPLTVYHPLELLAQSISGGIEWQKLRCGRPTAPTTGSRTSSPTRRWRWSPSCSASSGRGARSCSPPAASARPSVTRASCPASCPRPRASATATWQVAPAPADLQDRRVEITGPTDRKMVINALNSGARGFMADFEDSNSPTLAATCSAASATCATRSTGRSTSPPTRARSTA